MSDAVELNGDNRGSANSDSQVTIKGNVVTVTTPHGLVVIATSGKRRVPPRSVSGRRKAR